MSLQQLLSSLLPAAVGINLVEMINKRVLVAVVVIGKGNALISLCSLMELIGAVIGVVVVIIFAGGVVAVILPSCIRHCSCRHWCRC